LLTAERFKEVLHYDPETGDWTWCKARQKCSIGSTVGAINNFGYRLIDVDDRQHLSSRLAFLYMTGSWPQNQVDPIDRVDAEINAEKFLRPPHR
jgi:hypothetical protein